MPFQRDVLIPLVGGAGNLRWFVDRILDHCDLSTPTCHGGRRRDAPRDKPQSRLYRVRWLGFLAEGDSWEPRKTLLEHGPDIVKAYEAAAIEIVDAGQSAMQGDSLTEVESDDTISPSRA